MRKSYFILVEDTGRTHNINMHTYECFAHSKEEAVGKMWFDRPEFRSRPLCTISEEGKTVYIDERYKTSIDNAKIHLFGIKLKNENLKAMLGKITGWQDEAESLGEKLETKQDFIKGDKLNQAEDTWIIDVSSESFFYENLADADNDFQLLRRLLNTRTENFEY